MFRFRLLAPISPPSVVTARRRCSSSSSSSSSCFTLPLGNYPREYYYHFDSHGHLYNVYDGDHLLPPTTIGEAAKGSVGRESEFGVLPTRGKVPHGPAFLRDPKFLDFFTKNLCLTPSGKSAEEEKKGEAGCLPVSHVFPFVSKCGKEGNYLHMAMSPVPAAIAVAKERRSRKELICPVSFHRLVLHHEDQEEKEEESSNSRNEVGQHHSLVFGGTLRQPLHPDRLKIDRHGYLYHPVTVLPRLQRSFYPGFKTTSDSDSPSSSLGPVEDSPAADCVFYGKVSSHVCLELGLTYVTSMTSSVEDSTRDGGDRGERKTEGGEGDDEMIIGGAEICIPIVGNPSEFETLYFNPFSSNPL